VVRYLCQFLVGVQIFDQLHDYPFIYISCMANRRHSQAEKSMALNLACPLQVSNAKLVWQVDHRIIVLQWLAINLLSTVNQAHRSGDPNQIEESLIRMHARL